MRWRRNRREPKNVNKYLAQEAELKRIELVEKDNEAEYLVQYNFLLENNKDKLSRIKRNTTELMHRVVYMNSKVDEKLDRLEIEEKHIKNQKLLRYLKKKENILNKTVK